MLMKYIILQILLFCYTINAFHSKLSTQCIHSLSSNHLISLKSPSTRQSRPRSQGSSSNEISNMKLSLYNTIMDIDTFSMVQFPLDSHISSMLLLSEEVCLHYLLFF